MMKATGIVRRIDDLGRVVIPKEIRRNLRIREGDPLEIFVDRDGEVILKKYSPIGELADFAREYAEAINEVLGKVVLISDRDTVISVAGGAKKDFLGKRVGAAIEKALEERRALVRDEARGLAEDSLFADGSNQGRFASEVIVPIVSQGDPIGAVIICGEAAANDVDCKVAQAAAGVLSRQMVQ